MQWQLLQPLARPNVCARLRCLQNLAGDKRVFLPAAWSLQALGFGSVLALPWRLALGPGNVSWTWAHGPRRLDQLPRGLGKNPASTGGLSQLQFLLINIISAAVQVDKLTLADEPAFLPLPNDVILTGSDEHHSLLPSGTKKGWDLTEGDSRQWL